MDLQTRNTYMKAMGIPVWMPKADVEARTEQQPDPAPEAISYAPVSQEAAKLQAEGANESPVQAILRDAGQAKAVRPAPAVAEKSPPQPQQVEHQTELPALSCADMDWNTLNQAVTACERCDLHRTRTQTVFGVGNQQADWLIIGEAPGAEEDRRGDPFVGKAGQLLNNMLAAVGLPREAVYIANILKCRPPNNRDPKPDEAAACRAYLERQIELVNPALILVVGRIAAQNLLQVKTPLGRLRGRVHHSPLHNIPVVVTYHPAYLLRQPADKRKAWQDLLLAQQLVSQ